ncbi:hypothetical protein NP493_599g02062 [Ridgeia piscesae]|uniref:Calpain catalytic domain-containing protein n=1 Tax=Ridgeia piscesae TaxID=27915 RepID=A0AAD9NQV6_RIDPI|nr:hypothetical protein NP493_599g02062 [Ridgeia piscesae]
MSRRYQIGFGPRRDKGFRFQPTIRDIGGLGRRADYQPRGDDEQPNTYDDVKATCQEEGCLWEDPDFPAEESSIYFKDPPSVWPDIEWLRPGEICDDPQLFIDGANRMDVNQGILGDCWLLAAVSCLATNQKLLHRVIPDGQNFEEGDYAGVFRFVLWQYGRWVEVLIDDRLPTNNGKLIYMHSDDKNEFWSALLEKAYAKLNGSYESLSGGLTSEALTDFTGGVVERFQLKEQTPDDLYKRMVKAFTKGALMGCSIDASPDEMEGQLDNGLIIGHAYSITDVRYVDVETPRVSGRIPMVRVRNPWGDSHEWKGAWGDGSEEWSLIQDDEREEMGLMFDHDGEFWMSYKDFSGEYEKLEICHLGPDTLAAVDNDEEDTKWEGSVCDGSWKRRVNAGGCRNFADTFWTNPQFRVSIVDPDEDDEDGNGSIIVGLMQKERRKMRMEGKDNHTIGYAIYELANTDSGTLDRRYLETHRSAAMSKTFTNLREVSGHHSLPPGDYVIIPSTFEPNEEGDFVLRIFSEQKHEVNELDEETGLAEPDVSNCEMLCHSALAVVYENQ